MATSVACSSWTCGFPASYRVNAIIYYANQIFASAGFSSAESQAIVTTWAIGGVNVLTTLVAIAFIDNQGRRKLLLTGLVGMGVSLTDADNSGRRPTR
jgi:hypothetical protein